MQRTKYIGNSLKLVLEKRSCLMFWGHAVLTTHWETSRFLYFFSIFYVLKENIRQPTIVCKLSVSKFYVTNYWTQKYAWQMFGSNGSMGKKYAKDDHSIFAAFKTIVYR